MERTYFLSVLYPLAGGCHRVDVLRVTHAAGLQWMRQHADDIATRATGPGYVALMVRDELPADERAALPA